jgi:hypothetical protein
MQEKKYTELRSQMQTGDLILFSGNTFVSKCIEFFTNSKISHVGLIIKLSDILYCYEVIGSGVRLIDLNYRIKTYPGICYYRSVLWFRPLDITDQFLKLREEFKNKKYEKDIFEFIGSAWDKVFGLNKRDLKYLFCSEMVAEIYQRWEILDTKKSSNEYTPDDFSKINLSNNFLKLFGGLIKIV